MCNYVYQRVKRACLWKWCGVDKLYNNNNNNSKRKCL